MNKYFILLSSCLLIALAGGCGDSGGINDCGCLDSAAPPPAFVISFIDSEGQDLVEGIPTVTWEQYAGDFLSNNAYQMKLFVDEEEEVPQGYRDMSITSKEENIQRYDAIRFTITALWGAMNDPSDIAVHTARCEFVCPYIFGSDEVHTLTGELSRGPKGGDYFFRRFWFDGVECPPLYDTEGSWLLEDTYIVQVNR
jgi:hypothetical protein